MANELKGMKIAILVTDGFEQSEMVEPRKALQQAGAQVDLVSPMKGKVKAWTHGNWSDEYSVDIQLDQAKPENYAALMLPGGVISPDRLRITPKAIEFIKHFVKAKKPIAAICHGPWTLINADGVKGHKMTSWGSLQADLTNAGAKWVDEPMVRDGQLVTSRNPNDLPVFNAGMVALFAESRGK